MFVRKWWTSQRLLAVRRAGNGLKPKAVSAGRSGYPGNTLYFRKRCLRVHVLEDYNIEAKS